MMLHKSHTMYKMHQRRKREEKKENDTNLAVPTWSRPGPSQGDDPTPKNTTKWAWPATAPISQETLPELG